MKIASEDKLLLLNNDTFGNIADAARVIASRHEQLNRAIELACECDEPDLVKHLHELGAQIRGNSIR